jgi:hypothetical protein
MEARIDRPWAYLLALNKRRSEEGENDERIGEDL